jgi:replicative DNA helicase
VRDYESDGPWIHGTCTVVAVTEPFDDTDLFWPTTALPEAMAHMLDRIEHNGRNGDRAVPTGVTHIDRQTGGLAKGQVTVIAGLRGSGATALALLITMHAAAELEYPVLYVATRDPVVSLMKRLLGREAKVPAQNVNTGRLRRSEWDAVGSAVQGLSKVPVSFYDHPLPSVDQLMVAASRLERDRPLGLVIIDRLPGLRGWRRGDGTARRRIANALSSMAQSLDLPVVVLANLRRKAGQQPSPPTSDDVRSRTAMEQFRHFILVSQNTDAVSGSCGLPTARLDIEDPIHTTEPVHLTWVEAAPARLSQYRDPNRAS